MRRKLVLITAVVAITACVSFMVTLQRAAEQEKRGAQLLRAINTIRVSVSTLGDADRIAKEFGDLRPWAVPCSRQQCEYTFVVLETALSRMGLGRPARFGADLKTQDGVVVWKSVSLEAGYPPYAPNYWAAEAIESTILGQKEGFRVRGRRDETGSFTTVDVHLTPAATEDQRRRAFAVNLGCLSKLGGCRDVRQILPLITPGER